MTAAQISTVLKGRKSGDGYVVRCVAHEDSSPSLSLTNGDDGKLLAHCFAGCTWEAIMAGLKDRGLLEPAPLQLLKAQQSRIVAIYQYVDEGGKVLYEVIRKEPGRDGRKKDFFQRYADRKGGWIWKKHPRQILYRLTEVLENPIIFVTEGEKDAETLRSHGFVATTNAGGSEAPWLPSFTQALRGREIVLLPDNDKPGRLRVLKIARALLGHAAKVIILQLDGAKDVTEWFEKGHSEVEFIAHLEGEQVSQ